MQIGDPVLRRDVFEEVMEHSIEANPYLAGAMREALEKSNALEEWKRRWRAPQ